VGYALARRLLRESPNRERLEIIMGCRSKARATAARDQLMQEFPTARLHILIVDVGSTASCIAACKELQSRYFTMLLATMLPGWRNVRTLVTEYLHLSQNKRFPHLDYFFANAGMIPVIGYNWVSGIFQLVTSPSVFLTTTNFLRQRVGAVTSEGVGEVFAANLYGHFVMVRGNVVMKSLSIYRSDPNCANWTIRYLFF
jgi:17beta-estradiol 17-dehydrogenase/3beta-hydroxysteroid 3-dehydrogenase